MNFVFRQFPSYSVLEISGRLEDTHIESLRSVLIASIAQTETLIINLKNIEHLSEQSKELIRMFERGVHFEKKITLNRDEELFW